MKKLIILILFSLIFNFISCGSNNSKSEKPSEEKRKSTKYVIAKKIANIKQNPNGKIRIIKIKRKIY